MTLQEVIVVFEEEVRDTKIETGIQPQQQKRTYTVDEIQDILGISKTTAYALVKEKQFKCINVGRHIRISKKSFDEWLDEQA